VQHHFLSDFIVSHVVPNGFMNDVILNAAEGPVRRLLTFASVNAANGSIPAACAFLFVRRKVLR
jgi:hypothetical protein